MYTDVPPAFLDLIDIATYVYVADQALTRGGDGLNHPTDIGHGWRRRLHFRIPVREPDLWNSQPVHDHLVSTLSFLTEDEYYFQFEHLKKDTSLRGYLDFGGTPYDGIVDDVVLFSGGLDSLAGAVQESVVERRKVLLVNHRSTEKMTPRHLLLSRLLESRAKESFPLHLPVRLNKEKRLGREYTQRSRSFVYAALGATIARMIGLDRIRFYENGVVSLNLPPSAQVVGARATRTTHPRVLNGFAKLISCLAGKPFTVENPFLWKTKTDIVKLIADAGCAGLIRYSTSCTHTWEMTKQHTHCGGCSQCIDRRFAVLAAGQESHDPSEAYKVDLLNGPRKEGEPKAMLAAYVETANEINSMEAVEFFGRFGETARAVRELGGDASESAEKVFELYKTHARHVVSVVDQAITKYAPAIRTRKLPPTCLVRLVCDSTSMIKGALPSAPSEPPASNGWEQPSSPYVFQKRGEAWEVRYAGGKFNILLPTKGAAYLHMLLSRPHSCLSAIELACQAARNRSHYSLSDAGERIDREAMSAYRARYHELSDELEKAKADHDAATQARIEPQMELLLAEIRSANGVGGRIRKDHDDADRVRKAVGNAIRRTVEDIGQFDRPLAAHLQLPRLSCGRAPCYRPDQSISWVT
jgi:hypothetical protein